MTHAGVGTGEAAKWQPSPGSKPKAGNRCCRRSTVSRAASPRCPPSAGYWRQRKVNNMKTYYERQVDRAGRIEGYGINHPLTPMNARANVLFGQVTVVKLQMRDLGMNQVHGFGLFRGGASERTALASELAQTLSGIWETARALDPVQYPNAAEQFRLPAKPRHQQLIDYGLAFLGAIGPI